MTQLSVPSPVSALLAGSTVRPEPSDVPPLFERNIQSFVCFSSQIWILPSIACAVSLYQESDVYYEFLASAIYGASLILLFSVSTAFHLISFAFKDR